MKNACLSIRMGYTFRTRLEPDPAGDVLVLQMKDITPFGGVDPSDLVRWRADNLKPSMLLEANDVVFQSRGLSNTAAIVPAGLTQVIASAPLIVIRTDPVRLDPVYLWWFLNHADTRKRLSQQATGVTVRLISIVQLADLEMPLPPMDRQKKIAAVARLAEQERELLEVLREKRTAYLERTLMKAAR